LPVLMGLFRFAALEAGILNKTMKRGGMALSLSHPCCRRAIYLETRPGALGLTAQALGLNSESTTARNKLKQRLGY